jgi:hypothetical protein
MCYPFYLSMFENEMVEIKKCYYNVVRPSFRKNRIFVTNFSRLQYMHLVKIIDRSMSIAVLLFRDILIIAKYKSRIFSLKGLSGEM